MDLPAAFFLFFLKKRVFGVFEFLGEKSVKKKKKVGILKSESTFSIFG